jgi:hypothetical protein
LVGSAALVVAALLAGAVAQPFGPGAGIMGSGMGRSRILSRGGFRGICDPVATNFAERQIEWLAELVKPTEAQRAKFDDFKTASIKSTRAVREACPSETPSTIVGRAEAMEKRMVTMLQAVRTMRSALEAF